MADEFCMKTPDFHVTFRDLLHTVNYDMGQTALLPFRRMSCWEWWCIYIWVTIPFYFWKLLVAIGGRVILNWSWRYRMLRWLLQSSGPGCNPLAVVLEPVKTVRFHKRREIPWQTEVLLRSVLFWHFMQHRVSIPSRHSGRPCRYHSLSRNVGTELTLCAA